MLLIVIDADTPLLMMPLPLLAACLRLFFMPYAAIRFALMRFSRRLLLLLPLFATLSPLMPLRYAAYFFACWRLRLCH